MSYYFVPRCTPLGSLKRNALLGRPAKTRGLTCTGDPGPPPRAGHCSDLRNGMRPMSRAVGFTEVPSVKCSARVLAHRSAQGTPIFSLLSLLSVHGAQYRSWRQPWRVVGSSSGRGGLKGHHHIQRSHASDGSGQAPASAALCGPHIKLPPAPSRRAHSACHSLVHIRTPAQHALTASLLHLPSPS